MGGRHLAGLVALLAMAACSDQTTPISAPVNARAATAIAAAQQAVAPPSELVLTPAGWYHKSCVHQVPSGSHVNALTGVVTPPGATPYHLGKCLYPGRRNRNGVRVTSPADSGWMEWAAMTDTSYFSDVAAHWKVPAAPSSYSGEDVFYSFPGAQSNEYILQPVLQYGYNGDFGGQYWSAASWHCNDDCTYSTPITSISDSAAIVGEVSSSACVSGQCTWTVATIDSTADTRTSMTWTDTVAYFWAVGGAVEVYDITNCDQYPQAGVVYSDISLKDASGQPVTPTWVDSINPNNQSPSCDFNVTTTATTVHLDYGNAAPTVTINGPTTVRPNSTCYYSSTVSGGTSPYSYEWYQDNGVIGTDSGVDASATGYVYGYILTLTVTDSNGLVGSARQDVTITASAPICRS